MYIKSLSIVENPTELQLQLADKVRLLRLAKNLSQELFAKKAGLSYATYRKFEHSGEISLKSFIKIAIALNNSDVINNLFTQTDFASMDDLLASKKNKTRKRARSHEK